MTETDPREGKLPKWAQAAFAELRDQLDAVTLERDRLAKGKLGPRDSDTVALLGADNDVSLPNHCSVEYTLGYRTGDRLIVYVDSFSELVIQGAGEILVAPQAANVVRIKMAP